MSNVLTITLTEAEIHKLKKEAAKANTTVSAYIHDKIFPVKPNILTVNRILERLEELINNGVIDSKCEFTIANLFDEQEYCQYFNVIPVGRTFAKLSINPASDVYKKVEYIEGTKPAKYKLKSMKDCAGEVVTAKG